jgi:hypothetical protein
MHKKSNTRRKNSGEFVQTIVFSIDLSKEELITRGMNPKKHNGQHMRLVKSVYTIVSAWGL